MALPAPVPADTPTVTVTDLRMIGRGLYRVRAITPDGRVWSLVIPATSATVLGVTISAAVLNVLDAAGGL